MLWECMQQREWVAPERVAPECAALKLRQTMPVTQLGERASQCCFGASAKPSAILRCSSQSMNHPCAASVRAWRSSKHGSGHGWSKDQIRILQEFSASMDICTGSDLEVQTWWGETRGTRGHRLSLQGLAFTNAAGTLQPTDPLRWLPPSPPRSQDLAQASSAMTCLLFNLQPLQ